MKRMKEMTSREAWRFLQEHPDALLVDVRSEIEFLFVGHPVGARHVSWNDGPEWDINPHFVGEVKKLAGNVSNRPVLLICRSGNRSAIAGLRLIEAGFSNVCNIVDGFEGDLDENHHRSTVSGWRFEGLPWEQC